MATKLLYTYGNGALSAKVYKDYEWETVLVKFFRQGKHLKNADYDTLGQSKDCVHDACLTAKRYCGI